MPGLEDSKLFSSLTAEEIKQLRDASICREFEPEQTIFQEGDEGDGIYVVTHGHVQISALINSTERRVLSRVAPGDFFGEMAVLDCEPRSATATTIQHVKAVFIPRETLLEMIERSPRLAVSLVREFSLRMRDFNRQYIAEVLQAERLTLVGRFARSIIHDFKNPLNIIGLATELMQMDKGSDELRQNATSRIRKQVERLTNMINELLEFTRGAQNHVVPAQLNYHDLVRGVVEELRSECADKQVEIQFENEPPPVILPGDPKRLLHVFHNIIHNAVDAMPDGGRVILRFEQTPREVITEIEDTGSGIAPEVISHLFEAFATFGKAKGTGLGLSICKRIVEDHKGWIKARSEPGRGAVFAFGLPIARTEPECRDR